MEWCATAVCIYDFARDWQTLIAGFAAFVAAVLTVRALRVQADKAGARTELIASMQIASQIRLWLIQTAHVFEEHPIFDEPDPDGDPRANVFPRPSDIPPFPFENSLNSISLLESNQAQLIFGLVEQRLNAEKEAGVTAYLEDHQEAAEIFETRIAMIFVDCVAIYTTLAERVGWQEPSVGERTLSEMRKRAARLEEILNRDRGTGEIIA
jgi:hypothetical protein